MDATHFELTEHGRALSAPFEFTRFAKAVTADANSAVLFAALVEDVLAAASAGDDPEHVAEAYREYIDDPELLADALEEPTVGKAWDSSKHPRDDHGRFVGKEQLHQARTNPAVAELLRDRVTNPEERAKLDRIISGEVTPPHTARSQARAGAAQRRRDRAATKQRADEIIRSLAAGRAAGGYSRDDLHALADHLPRLTVADLRRARQALAASFGGDRRKADMVNRLRSHVAARMTGPPEPTQPTAPVPAPLPSPPPPARVSEHEPPSEEEFEAASRPAKAPAPAAPPANPRVAPPTAPPVMPQRVTFVGATDPARREMAQVMGYDYLSGVESHPPEIVAAAGNASDGARVTVDASAGHVRLNTRGPGHEAMRTFHRTPDGKLICHNDLFMVEWVRDRSVTDGRYPGWRRRDPGYNGTELMANQVRALRAMGAAQMETYACRSDDDDPNHAMNGYYTWPRLGYDGAIPDRKYQALPPELKALVDSNPTGSTTRRSVLNLMSTEAGRKWWKEHGQSISCKFDLADNSLSMRTLAKYLEERKSGDE